MLILSIMILVSSFPKQGKFKYEYLEGKPWMHEDLIAPYDFAILKTQAELQADRENAISEIKPYFNFDSKAYINAMTSYENSFEASWKLLNKDDSQKMLYKNTGFTLLDSVLRTGVINLSQLEVGFDKSLMVIHENIAEECSLDQLFTLRDAYLFFRNNIDIDKLVEKDFLLELLEKNLTQTLIYNPQLTEAEKNDLLDKVSLTRGMVQEGERIIDKGELVSKNKFQILESMRNAYDTKVRGTSSYTYVFLGQVVLVTIALLAFFLYLYFFRKDIYGDNRSLLLILLVIIITVLLTSLTTSYYSSYIYLIPICMAPIVIRAFFDSTIGLIVLLITVIIVGFLVPNSFEFIFLQLIAGIVTVISIVNLHRRSQFFLTSMLIFLTYSLIYVGLSLIHEGSFEQISTRNFVLFAGNSVLTLFAYPLIYLFEKIFGYITDVTLMELSDTNNKLLRELASKAPGTFQHSLQVANIAEDVIYSIGGNALLVRTGALYHDIGKLVAPMYFIENQSTGVNPHDDLTYEESAKIIVSHVIKGVEKAKKHNLPEQIIDFIRTHHGTRRAEYFYLKQKERFPDEQVDASLFSYNGPVPFSRETAVLMMADSVEAASRSLKTPDAEKIENLVENIINSHIDQGQLKNADLTLKEVTIIKKMLKKKMMNIYHVRIEYPEG